MRFLFALTLGVCLHAETRQLDLKAAAALAESQHPTLALAKLETLLARQEERIVRSAYGPQIQGLAESAYQTTNLQGIGLIFPGFGARVGPFRTFNLRPQATQTLIDLSLLASIKATRFQTAQKRFNEETAREALRVAAVQLYLQVFEARARRSAAQARIRGAEALVQQVETRESLGGASKLDVSRQREQLEAERVALTSAERDERILLTSLKEALGVAQSDDLELRTPLLLPPASEAAVIRAEQKALDAQRQAAEWNLDAAKKERLPKLTGFGDFGVFGASPTQNLSTYQIGARLTVPLWTSGRLDAQIAKARLAVEQAQTARRREDLRIEQEIAAAREEYRATQATIERLTAQLNAARETVELTKLRVEAGLATATDSTTAQAIVAETEESLIRTRYGQQVALARWAYARGDLGSVLP